MRWGKDNEERAAVVQKAHDAYATASAAREAMAGVTARVEALAGEVEELRPLIDHMRRVVAALGLRVDELERARVLKQPRKAA